MLKKIHRKEERSLNETIRQVKAMLWVMIMEVKISKSDRILVKSTPFWLWVKGIKILVNRHIQTWEMLWFLWDRGEVASLISPLCGLFSVKKGSWIPGSQHFPCLYTLSKVVSVLFLSARIQSALPIIVQN